MKGPAVVLCGRTSTELESTDVGDHAIRVLLDSVAGKWRHHAGGYGKSAWKGTPSAEVDDAEGTLGSSGPGDSDDFRGQRTSARCASGGKENPLISPGRSAIPGVAFSRRNSGSQPARFASPPDWRTGANGSRSGDFRGNERTAVSSVAALAQA
jgi:hypothetical protein